MWVRKTPEEIEAVDRRTKFNPFFPLIAGAVTSFVALFDENGLFWKTKLWSSENAMLDMASTGSIAFVCGFVFFYVFQLIVMMLWPVRSPLALLFDKPCVICEHCQSVQHSSESNICSFCGGNLDTLERWRWINDAR